MGRLGPLRRKLKIIPRHRAPPSISLGSLASTDDPQMIKW
jgi:hypothetical protein